MKLFLVLSCLFTALSATSASADILLFDLNISELELQGARAAAQARGENLIVFPDMPESNRKQIQQYSNREVEVHDRIYEISLELEKPGLTVAQEKALDDESDKLESEEDHIRVARRPYLEDYFFDYQEMNKLFSDLATKKIQLTSIVISSHAGPGIFQGLVASFTTNQLNQAIQSYANGSGVSIHSLLLWGCYTATLNDLQYWKAALPGSDLLFGFGVIAPSGIRPASGYLLEDVLRNEETLASASDLSAQEKEFESLHDIGLTSAAAAIGDNYFEIGAKPISLQSQPSCAKLLAAYTKYQPTYENYLSAQNEGYENPPLDTHHSALRDYYTAIQVNAGCSFLHTEPEALSGMPSESEILGLIFFDHVRRNFGAYYANDIASINSILKKLPTSPAIESAILPEFASESLTRRDILTQTIALQLQSSSISDPKIQAFSLQEADILYNLHCIPFSWETDEPVPGVKPDAPTCAAQ